jgi:hypothetical protein
VLFIFRFYVARSKLPIKFALAYCAVRLLFVFPFMAGILVSVQGFLVPFQLDPFSTDVRPVSVLFDFLLFFCFVSCGRSQIRFSPQE